MKYTHARGNDKAQEHQDWIDAAYRLHCGVAKDVTGALCAHGNADSMDPANMSMKKATKRAALKAENRRMRIARLIAEFVVVTVQNGPICWWALTSHGTED